MSGAWPLAAVLLVRSRDEVTASIALAEACLVERRREAEHAAAALAVAACAGERARAEAEGGGGPAADLQAAARRVALLRDREVLLGGALARAALAWEDAAVAVTEARRALSAARRAREVLEERRAVFLREARARREERASDEAHDRATRP